MELNESILDRTIDRFRNKQRRDLIPLLLAIQKESGMISEEAVSRISSIFNIAASKVYGVASFFDELCFEPRGKFVIKVCKGTNCHLYHSENISNEVGKHLRIKPGETTRDGIFSLEEVNCLGGCDLSPVIKVNEAVHANVTANSVKEILDYYITKAGSNE